MEVYKVVLSSSTLTEIYRIKQYLKILIDVWVSATQVFIMMINQVSNNCILLQDVFLFVVWEIEQPIKSLMSQIKFNLIFVSIATWNTVEISFMWETIIGGQLKWFFFFCSFEYDRCFGWTFRCFWTFWTFWTLRCFWTLWTAFISKLPDTNYIFGQ